MNFKNLSFYYFFIVVSSRFLNLKGPTGFICLVANSAKILATCNQNVAQNIRIPADDADNAEIVCFLLANCIMGAVNVHRGFSEVIKFIFVLGFCIFSTIFILIVNWLFIGYSFFYVLIPCVLISYFLVNSTDGHYL